jgi:hypothetical protein
MTRIIGLLIIAASMSLGCQTAGDEQNLVQGDAAKNESALLSCTSKGASPIGPNLWSVSASCSGHFCFTTCGDVCEPWQCDLLYLPAACRTPPELRINTGWPGISQATCQGAQGASWDNTFSGVPWCYGATESDDGRKRAVARHDRA